MEYINTIINDIMSQFDFGFMFTINVATYIFIKFWDALNGNNLLTTWQKRLMLLIAVVLTTTVYVMSGYPNKIILFNSIIFAPVFWSWVLKPILTKFGIGYKKIDDYLS